MFELFSCFVLTTQQEVRILFFYIRGESAYSAVQFTVPVFLGFTFHKILEFREKKVMDWLPMKPLGAP